MTAVTTPTTNANSGKGAMVKLLEPRAEVLAKLLPKGLNVERAIAAAQLAAYQNPDLLKCDPVSIFLSVGKIAMWGLEVGTTAYLVPFGKTCTAVKDFKGVIELICRARAARTVRPGVVRDGDYFEVEEGTTPFIKHRPLPNNAGAVTHFYAVAYHGRDIPPTFKWMTVAQVEAHRQKFSKQHKSGSLPEWYGVKTCVHLLGKTLVQNPEANLALDDDEYVPNGEFSADVPLTPLERFQPPRQIMAGDYPQVPEARDDFDPNTGEDFRP